MDATEMLVTEHAAVRALFAAFENAAGNAQSRGELFRQIRDALELHAQIEEELFYPALEAAVGLEGKAEDLVKHSLKEHRKLDALLQEITQMDAADRAFVKQVKKLEMDVEHHVREEEDDMFPLSRRLIGTGKLEELGRRMRARSQELSLRDPHALPRAPRGGL